MILNMPTFAQTLSISLCLETPAQTESCRIHLWYCTSIPNACENQSNAAGTNNQSRTNLYFYITHSAKSEKNPADLLHPSPPSNPHCSPTNITAWPFSSGCSGAALAGALWRQKVMSESS